MQYNFNEIIDRDKNHSAKFEEANLHYGTNDLIPLWIADMDFKTAEPIIKALKEKTEQGIFGYTFRPDEYFQSICNWQKKRNDYAPDIEKISFAPGVVPAMRIFLQLFSSPDASVLIQQPVYHPFADIVLNTGRNLVVNELKQNTEGQYEIDFEDFEDKIKSGIDLFILCNPHNPVGRVWTKGELQKMGDICYKHGVRILSDEIHSDLILIGQHTVMAGVSDDIQSITTTFIAPSKTFNLAGLQSCSVIFDTVDKKNRFVSELKEMDIARNNCFSLVATIAAYTEGEEWLEQLLSYIKGNIEFIKEYCSNYIPDIIPNTPEATYLIWLDTRKLKISEDELMEILVEKAKVGLSRGSEFGRGGNGFLRLNAACPRSVLEKALNCIKEEIENL